MEHNFRGEGWFFERGHNAHAIEKRRPTPRRRKQIFNDHAEEEAVLKKEAGGR